MGIDPGLAKTGWGVIEAQGQRAAHVASGVIVTRSTESHVERLRKIGGGLREVLAEAAPELIAVERVFINHNAKSSLLLGEARGAALLALLDSGAPVEEITALQIKQSVTGNGRADKARVANMVGQLLGFSTTALPHDCTDALACALAANAMRATHFSALRQHRRGRRTLRAVAKLRQ